MRVTVDSEKCQGHNRCYALAPDVFDVDDLGFATSKFEGDIPTELEDCARIDGMTRLGAMWKIAIPLARPACLSASGFLTF